MLNEQVIADNLALIDRNRELECELAALKTRLGAVSRIADELHEDAAELAESYGEDANEEIADTIQAYCNLASALGVTDLTPYLARCEERNRERGRYDSGDR